MSANGRDVLDRRLALAGDLVVDVVNARRVLIGLVALLVGLVGLVGCSDSGAEDESTSGSRSSVEQLPGGATALGKTRTVAGKRNGSITVEVPGIGTIIGDAGALTKGASLEVTPVSVPSPGTEVDGATIVSMGTGLLVEVSGGRLRAPLEVAFPNASATPGDSLVALHVADDGTASLLPASTPESGGLTLVTGQFSIVDWAVAKILRPVGDFMAAKLAGRTSPAQCDSVPSWASADPTPSGSTHACVRAGTPLADGTEIAELEIKSNRGNYQWVQLASALPREYVWVEEQNDLVRALIDVVFQRGDTVLLPPGARMTVGYRQPDRPTQLQFRTYVDIAAGAMTIMRLATDAATDDAIDKTGGYLAALSCVGVANVSLANLDNPAELRGPEVITSLLPCVIGKMTDFYADPAKATSAAGNILGPGASDVALTGISQDLFKLGRFASVFIRVITLGSYIFKEVAFITDAIVGEFGEPNAALATLTLAARPPKTTSPSFLPYRRIEAREYAQFAQVLRTSGMPEHFNFDDYASCYLLQVTGWDPQGDVDLFVDWLPDLVTRGRRCGGSSSSMFFAIRSGTVVDSANACYPRCTNPEGEADKVAALRSALMGRPISLAMAHYEATGWYIWGVSEDILKAAR